MRSGAIPMTIGGAEYVAIPKADYQELIGEPDAEMATTAALLRAARAQACPLYTYPSPRDRQKYRTPSTA